MSMDASNLEPPGRARNRRYSIRLRLALLAGALCAALGLAESVVRVLGIDRPRTDLGVAPHPLWHHWHRPNYEFHFQVAAEGTAQPVRFNALGMRDDREIAEAKAPGVVRLAVLGDSFAEALQVAATEGVCRRLEEHLRSAGAAKVEVLNFGCSGFSSTLELVQLRAWVRRFSPDLVICLHHFSDVSEDWALASRAHYEGERIHSIRPNVGGSERMLKQGLEHSQLFRIARGTWDDHRRRRPPPSCSLRTSFDAIVNDPYTPEDLEAWDYSLDALGQMADLLREDGCAFLVAVIPIGTQVEPVAKEYAEKIGFQFLGAGRRLEVRGYQRQVADYCAGRSIRCLDLLDDFRAANPAGVPRLYLPRDQHWSAAGHDLAAKKIAEYVSQEKLLPGWLPPWGR